MATGEVIRDMIQTRPGPYPPSIAEITQASRAREHREQPRAIEPPPMSKEDAKRGFDLIRAKLAEVGRLRAAILQTLAENGHLADGEDCTLIRLKRAVGVE